MTYKYKTFLHLSFSGLGPADHAVPLEIQYTVRKGCEATREQPAEGPEVNITKIALTDQAGIRYRDHRWLTELVEGSEELTAELISEAAAADECARDEHADAMRREIRL
jgi:hypothetical protein